MDFDLNHLQTAGAILIGYGGIKIIDQAIVAGWRKVFGTHYVTVAECLKYRETCPAMQTIEEVRKEFSMIRKLLARHILADTPLPPDQKKELEKMML